MPNIDLFGRTIGLLQKTLDLRMENHQAIAANIANVDTPKYRAVHLDFESGLRRALAGSVKEGGGAESFAKVEARVVRETDPSDIGDHNSVSLDDEMIALAENQMLYDAATQMISKKLAGLRYAIMEGK